MTDQQPTLDPAHVSADPRAAYDEARGRCPVAHDGDAWVALRHAEVVAAATDAATYSSAHPTRRAIPNSLDGDEHAAYRAIVDSFLTPQKVSREEPRSRRVAAQVIAALPRGEAFGAIKEIGTPFAVRAQCEWLGWPRELESELVAWMQENHAATRSGDREWNAEVAGRFDAMIRSLLDARRVSPDAAGPDSVTGEDVTSQVMRATVHGEPLTDAEIVSLLRNWTAGDLGSLAASTGVIAYLLATRSDVQRQFRERVTAGDKAWLEDAVNELLRIDDPFLSNRRVAAHDTELGGEQIAEGDRVVLAWTAANRDSSVFADPDAFDPMTNAPHNLVFGIGPHVCPARGLSLMELRVVVEELLSATDWIALAPGTEPVRETVPMGGWAEVNIVLS